MIILNNHMIADEGKVFRRIATGEDFGTEIFLGYSHYVGGVFQDPPHKDEADEFEEVDAPEEDEENEIELTDSEALTIILGYDA